MENAPLDRPLNEGGDSPRIPHISPEVVRQITQMRETLNAHAPQFRLIGKLVRDYQQALNPSLAMVQQMASQTRLRMPHELISEWQRMAGCAAELHRALADSGLQQSVEFARQHADEISRIAHLVPHVRELLTATEELQQQQREKRQQAMHVLQRISQPTVVREDDSRSTALVNALRTTIEQLQRDLETLRLQTKNARAHRTARSGRHTQFALSRVRLHWSVVAGRRAVTARCGQRRVLVRLEPTEERPLRELARQMVRDGRRRGRPPERCGWMGKSALIRTLVRHPDPNRDHSAYLRKTLAEIRKKLARAARALKVPLDNPTALIEFRPRRAATNQGAYRLSIPPGNLLVR